ncbi:MAG: Mobile element protein [Rickettsia helvetica]|uniref:Mobile element protein n=1 Tax=Rickettsia helvetica TaxID=35789 RepID=A0ABM9N9S7_RICHE
MLEDATQKIEVLQLENVQLKKDLAEAQKLKEPSFDEFLA